METKSWDEVMAELERRRPSRLQRFRWWLGRLPTPVDGWRAVRAFIQRGRRGWSDQDNWSMFSYLSVVMADMLADLREYGAGYHCVHEGSFPGVDGHECSGDDWNQLLHRMEFGLRYYLYVTDEMPVPPEEYGKLYDSAHKILGQTFADLGEYWGGLWD